MGFASLSLSTVTLALILSAYTHSALGASDPPTPSSQMDKALYAAVAAVDFDAAHRALADGARVNSIIAPWGDTALMIAAEKSAAMVTWLVKQDAKVNLQNRRGQTALMIAAYAGNVEALTTLLGRGADARIEDKSGDTALTQAVFRGDPAIVAQLIKHGADPTHANGRSETPRLLAKRMVDLVEAMDDGNDHAHGHAHADKDHVVTDKRTALRDRRKIVALLAHDSN